LPEQVDVFTECLQRSVKCFFSEFFFPEGDFFAERLGDKIRLSAILEKLADFLLDFFVEALEVFFSVV